VGLIELFLNNLLPVLLAVGAGYLAARYLKVDPRSLSRVTFYIFSPCLIFTLLTQSELSNGDILKMAAFAAGVVFLVGGIAWIAGRLFRLERRTLAAVVITSMFMNAGNFGLAVVNFGFGETALAYASVFFVTNAILVYTVGVLIASLGKASFSRSLLNLVKVPAIYAMGLAFLFMYTGWQLPIPLERTTGLLGDAAIAAMLVLLGLQLYSVSWAGNILPLALSSVVRVRPRYCRRPCQPRY
jgi:predicted permease